MKSCDEITKNVLAKRDAHNEKMKNRRRMIMSVGVPTVSLCLALIIGVGMWNSGDLDGVVKDTDAVTVGMPGEKGDVLLKNEADDDKSEIGTTPVKEEIGVPDDEIWIEPQWGEKALYAKYPSIDLGNDTIYSTAATWIDSSMVGEPIIEATAYGYDIYTDTEYKMDVVLYFIKGISTEAAVAVSYDGFEGQYAVYTDNWYYPETLGDFIEALNLKENLTFGNIYHSIYGDDLSSCTIYNTVDASDIWGMLLSDDSLKNVANEVSDEELSYYRESMSMSVNVDILGVNNVSLAVTENGYLDTNILGTRKLFFIGEKKAQEFFEYVEENYAYDMELTPSTTAVEEPKVSLDYYVDETVVVQTSGGYIPGETGVMTEMPYIPDGIVVETTSEEIGSGYDSYEIPPTEPAAPSEVVGVTEPDIEIAYE